MHKQISQMGETTMAKLTHVQTLSEYADKHGLEIGRLRRIARKNEWPTTDHVPFKWGGKHGLWAIDANAPKITLPAKSQRGARRADGRQRHIVFCNATEHVAVVGIVGNDNVIDPRMAAKSRRDARKLADELTAMADNAANDDAHPNDVVRAAELNAAELADIERGIDTLENDDNG